MSYTLEDLLAAASQQRQQPRYRNVSPQYRFNAPSYNGYPAFFGPSWYGLGDEDEEEDDYTRQPSYPDYYASPYSYARPVKRQQQAAPSTHGQRQEQEKGQEQSYSSGVDGLFDLLSQLTGQTITPGEALKRGAPEKKAEQKQEEPVSETVPKLAEAQNVQEQEKTQSQTAAVPPKATKRHSVASFQEPTPKIEISQRNFKNPSIPYSPQANIYESAESYDIVLAIPGATIQNLDIDFHPSSNELVIKGSIPETSALFGTSAEQPAKVNEIRTGSIERRIKFPNLPKILDEQIKAKYLNGLLSIKIPKNLETEKQKSKRKVTIEDVPDEELLYEERGGTVL